MGKIPPERPNRPDWMDDEAWRRILAHEIRRLDRWEQQDRWECWKMIVIALAHAAIGAAALWYL